MLERKIYLSNLPLDRARELFLNAALKRKMGAEELDTRLAAGRVTAEPVFASISSPHYHAAAMDGVAVKAADTFGAAPTAPRRLILKQNAFPVDTGGALPPECDAVIMIEDIIFPDRDNPEVIEIREAVAPWQHVRSIGEDVVAAEMIIPSYHLIRPFDLGALLSGGIFKLRVLKKPLISLIPTGLEIIPPGKIPEAGEIIESNTYTSAAAIENWGGEYIRQPVVRDEVDMLERAVRRAVRHSDLVLISAGSSAGRRDHTYRVLDRMGEVLVHGVAMRPGKPVVLALVDGVPVAGLPGYPVASYMVLELFIKPLLYAWQKQPLPAGEMLYASSSRRILSSLKEEEFLRLKVGKVNDKFIATPLPRGSGVSMSLVRADGLAVIPQDKEGVEAGEGLTVTLWRTRRDVENTIVCLGSHDLSLDILADHLKRGDYPYSLSSAHVGSMGGIMSLQREETHIAGLHLLDPERGDYNIPYLERYLPGKGIHLVHLARRELGLIIAPGNPRNISGIEDLTREDVLFVNRQKGAGTRVFLDYRLSKQGIGPEKIKGYSREEFNHLAVAAAVKGGSADVGLGIRAAASTLGMDFIPLAWEQYDLAIAPAFYDTLPCLALLEAISSPAFRTAVERMGGYDLKDSGKLLTM
ncbi:MAG: molybdopterin biosynthesis protein [Bacillota bacterium]